MEGNYKGHTQYAWQGYSLSPSPFNTVLKSRRGRNKSVPL